LDSYEILEKDIAKGTYGSVSIAKDKKSKRIVALKMIDTDFII
jgi:serine/threonine protein kinase